MIEQLPREIRQVLEKHGIEEDDISLKDDQLFIEFDDLDIGFAVREVTLDILPCCLITHPISKKPTLQINLQ